MSEEEQQNEHSPLWVIGQSRDDPEQLTPSMPIEDLMQRCSDFLPVEKLFVSSFSGDSIVLQEVGILRVEFIPTRTTSAPGPQAEGSGQDFLSFLEGQQSTEAADEAAQGISPVEPSQGTLLEGQPASDPTEQPESVPRSVPGSVPNNGQEGKVRSGFFRRRRG